MVNTLRQISAVPKYRLLNSNAFNNACWKKNSMGINILYVTVRV